MREIVNVNHHWAIGRDNDLLVNIPEDMKFFRKTTAGKIVIMGRKTLDSFPGGKPLVGRINIVLTGDTSRIQQASRDAAAAYIPDITDPAAAQRLKELTAQVLGNQEAPASARPTVLAAAAAVEDVLAFCEPYADEDIYVIGGASIYAKMLPYCDTCIVTINDSENEADTYFPNLDELGWKHAEIGEEKEYEGIHYHFDTFVRE